MSHGKLPCPECETMNDAPEAGVKKITCSSCGVILVLNKVYGDNWPAQAKKNAGAAAPSKPKIVSRKSRSHSTEATDKPSKPSRKSRGSSTRRPARGGSGRHKSADNEDAGHGTRHHKRSSTGMSNGMIFGSIGVFIVVALVGGLLWKNKKDETARVEKEAAALEQKKKDDAAAKAKEERDAILAKDAEANDAGDVADTKVEEKTAAVKAKKPAKKKFPRRKRDPFPETGIKPDVLATINKAIEVLKDPNATTARREADDSLFEHRKEAIPVLINAMMALDARDETQARMAYAMVESLRRCSEFSTKYDRNLLITAWPTDEKELDSNAKEREIVVLDWWKWWNKNKATWKPPVDSEDDF